MVDAMKPPPIKPGNRCSFETAQTYDERAKSKRLVAAAIRGQRMAESNYRRWQLMMADVYELEAELLDSIAVRLRKFIEVEGE